MKEVFKFAFVLFLICLVASLALAIVNKFARPKIIAQEEAQRKEALSWVLSEAASFKAYPNEQQAEYFLGLDENGEIIGYAFLAKAKGYSSQIVTMVGITPEGEISGIKIISHNETPGLGSQIDEPPSYRTLWDVIFRRPVRVKDRELNVPIFQRQFKGKSLEGLSEVDTISGATISSQAVIDAVRDKSKEILERIKQDGR